MSDPIRIAVAGAGLIGLRHIDIAAREGLLAAIVDPAPAGEAVARERGVPVYAGLDDLLARDRPDGVVVATPSGMHADHGLACVAAGVPALIEKPLVDSVADGERLVAAARAAGVPVLTGHHRRHNPIVRRAKEIVTSGALGRVVAVHVTFWLYKPEAYFDVAWRREPGAGPILINLIHDVDTIRYLCGEIATVQAMSASGVRGLRVEDTAAALLRFHSGAIGTVTASDAIAAPWSWELTAAENPAYPATGESSLLIGGTEGSLSLPDLGLWRYGAERSWMEPIAREALISGRGDPLVTQLRHFADVVRGVASPLVSAGDGLRTVKAVEAILRAAESGRLVEID